LNLCYFAYGSNMLARQMAERCAGARALGRAVLENWRFLITKRGSASIAPAPGRRVHGVLWRCSPEHFHTLDQYEGVRFANYLRRPVTVSDADGRALRAITYVGTRRQAGVARVDYMVTAVLPGALAFGLPEDYCHELSSWLAERPIGEQRIRYRGRRRPVRRY